MGARGIRRHALTPILVAATLVAACGGGDGSGTERTASTAVDAQTSTTTVDDPETTTTEAATTTTAEAGVETLGELTDEFGATAEGRTELEQLSLALLVVPGELPGPPFTDAGYLPPEGPNGCGIDVDAELSPDVLVGTGLVGDSGDAITEEIRVYADAATAAAAYQARAAAFPCGTDEGGTTYGPPVDVTADVGADRASEVTIARSGAAGAFITALVGDAVLTFDIGGPADAVPGLDRREVAAFGVGKVLAALERG